jgi:hypothetical protein
MDRQRACRRKSAEVKLSSNLVGLSSSLPEPFNKPATDVMPLNFERKPPPEPRHRARNRHPGPAGPRANAGASAPPAQDMLDVSIGRAWRLQLVRRHRRPPAGHRARRGRDGRHQRQPCRNAACWCRQPAAHRSSLHGAILAAGQGNGSDQAAALLPTLPALLFDLRTADSRCMDRSFHEVRINGSHPELAQHPLRTQEPGTGRQLRVGQRRRRQTDRPHRPVRDSGSGRHAGGLAGQGQRSHRPLPGPRHHRRPALVQGPAAGHRAHRGGKQGRLLDTPGRREERRRHAGIQRPLAAQPTQPDTRIEFKLSAKSIEKLLGAHRLSGHGATRQRQPAGNLSWNGTPFTHRLSDARRQPQARCRQTASSSSSNPASAACWASSACNPCRAASRSISATSSARASPSTASAASLPSRAA